MAAPYTALDIARYIVDRCDEKDVPVTNLKLQKVLYFVLGEYYRATQEWLFDDAVLAWRFGPVVRSVYDEYSIFGASSVFNFGEGKQIHESIRAKIDKTIDKRRSQSAGALVDEVHREGGAWATIYTGAKNTVIPRSLIAKDFCPLEAASE